MRFSIIIPAHNAEDRIRTALESIKCQTFKDYELIVVCDACVDDTAVIVKEYADKMYLVNFGCDGPARNIGLNNAEGEYILFMDDDDHWLHEDVLSDLSEQLDLNPNVDIMLMAMYWKHIGYVPVWSQKGIYPAVWCKCWKRSFIGDTRFPNVYSVSDLEFCKLMDAKKPKLGYWEYPFIYYNYMRPGSLTEMEASKNDRT